MIVFFILLIQSSLFANTTAPGCRDLSRILSTAEKDLMSTSAQNCRALDLATLLPKEITSEANNLFNDLKCAPLHQVETKIAELENQEALLLGFEKLKSQISTSHDTLRESENKEMIEKATSEFAQALNTAQTIEVMLDTQIPGQDSNFLQLLAVENPDLWSDVDKLKSIATQFCEKTADAKTLAVCSAQFNPNERTHQELRELLRTGSLSAEEAQQWKNSLSIQKPDGSTYSFVMMSDAIKESYQKLLKGESLSGPELESIKALDRFRSNPHFSFARKLPAPKGDTLIQSKIKSHFQSLKKRQEVEMNTKMSVVASINKDLMNDGERSSCSVVQIISEFDQACFNALKSTLERTKANQANDKTAQLSEAVDAFTRSQNYMKKLDELSSLCETNLQECAASLPLNMAQVAEELAALRAIKEKIGSDQSQNMKFRNFALSKWVNNCNSDIDIEKSIVEECQDTLSSMAPEMFKLSSSLMDISIVIDPKKISHEDQEVKELCATEEVKKLTDQRKLCAFFTDTVSDELPPDDKPQVNPDSYTAPVEAPKGSNPTREAWLKGLSMIANTAADTWIANNNNSYWGNTINPYSYNYGPYNMTGTMSTSEAILFNARYYGAYGFYMPTMGLQQHTAFGSSSISSYSALPRSSSTYSYFSK